MNSIRQEPRQETSTLDSGQEACGRAPGTQREEFLARLMDNARELLDRPATAWQKNKGA